MAQERVAVIFQLVDGSELSGYVTPIIMGAKTFTYSNEPKGQLNKMKLEKVNRMVSTDGEKEYVYEVVHILNPKNDKSTGLFVLRIVVEGHMNLYHFQGYSGSFHEFFIKPNPEAKGVYSAANADFGTSKIAKKSQEIWNKRFKKSGAKFFLDHPEITQDINEGKIDTKRMDELVIRYNKSK